MALKAWYRLDGNTNDSSGNGLNAIGYSGTFVDGLIESALEGDGSTGYFEHPQFFSSTVNYWNVSFWIKPANNASGYLASPNSGGIDHRLSYSSNQHVALNFIPQPDSSSDTIVSTNGSVPFEQWTHVSINANNYDVEIYINGKLNAKKTMAFNLVWSGSWEWLRRPNGTNYLAAILDDIRLYDAPITAAEIYKIAQAEFLHYPLSNEYEIPTTNYIEDPHLMNGWGNYGANDGTFNTELGTVGYRINNQLSWNGIYKDFVVPSTGTYTFSAWFKYYSSTGANNGATVYISGYGGGDTAVALDKSIVGKWQRVSHTINVTDTSLRYYIISYGGNSSVDRSTWEVTMPQIEKKDYATPFVIGTRPGGVRDLTDYNYFGTMTESTSPRWTNDSVNGFGSFKFNGSSQRIDVPGLIIRAQRSKSYAAWIKLDPSWSAEGVIFGDRRSSSNAFGVRSDRRPFGSEDDFSIGSSTVLNTGQWYHLAYTMDYQGSDVRLKLYLNGQLDSTINTVSYIDTYVSTISYVGFDSRFSYYFNGNISDMRVFSKLLTAEEVLNIYRTKAEGFKDGSFAARDFLTDSKETVNLIREVKNPTDTVTGGNEFARFADLSPIFDKYGSGSGVPYSLSLELRSLLPGTNNMLVYMQSGSGTEYGFVYSSVSVTNQFKRFTFNNLRATPTGSGYTTAHLAFYGVYGTGNIPQIRNVQIELGERATPFVSTYRPKIELPATLDFAGNEVHGNGVANFEDISTVGVTDGLEVYLPLNEPTVRNLAGTSYAPSTGGSYRGDHRFFNGSNDAIDTGFNNLPDWNTPFSLSIMVNIPASHTYSGAQTNIIGRGSYSNSVGLVMNSSNSLNFYLRTGSGGNSANLGTFNRDEWYHIIGTWDGNDTMRAYKNGELITTTTVSAKSNVPDSSNWYIALGLAFSGSNGGYLTASIKNAKIFNRALSIEEAIIESNTMFNNEVQISKDGILYAKDIIQY